MYIIHTHPLLHAPRAAREEALRQLCRDCQRRLGREAARRG